MSDVAPLVRYRVRRTWNGRLLLQHMHLVRSEWSDVKAGRRHVDAIEFEIVPVGCSDELVRLRARVAVAEQNAARHRQKRENAKARNA